MAITKNLVVTLKNDIAKPKEKMFVYRDDVGIEMVIELKDFNYSIDAVENRNNIRKAYALFRTPTKKTYQYTNIKILDGKLVFTFSQDIVNVMQEIGEYELQFQLYDKEDNRLTIPSYNFYVKEPLTVGGEHVGTAVVDESVIVDFGEEQDYIFVITDGYIKTEWRTGDLITKERLNKVENALSVITDAVNSKVGISQLHNHGNKEILDTISANKISEWDNKSNFNGDYNSLTNKPIIPTKVSDLQNDRGYLTEHQDISGKVDKVKGKSLISDDEIKRLSTLKNYDDTNINLQLNDIESELSTKADKTELHSHSNKTVLDGISSAKVTEWNNKSTFSGDYNDLTNKPTTFEPSSHNHSINDISDFPNDLATKDYVEDAINSAKLEGGDTPIDLTVYAKKTDLHNHSNKTILDNITTSKVNQWDSKSDFSGNYNDLTNKPIIPTKTSQLTNDSGYITIIPSEYITETELNSKSYLTEHQDISGKVDKINGYSLVSDAEISKLATLENYDDTEIHELINETNMSLDTIRKENNDKINKVFSDKRIFKHAFGHCVDWSFRGGNGGNWTEERIITEINSLKSFGVEEISCTIQPTCRNGKVTLVSNLELFKKCLDYANSLGIKTTMIKIHCNEFRKELNNTSDKTDLFSQWYSLVNNVGEYFVNYCEYFVPVNEGEHIFKEQQYETFLLECLRIGQSKGFKCGFTPSSATQWDSLPRTVKTQCDFIAFNCYPVVGLKGLNTPWEDVVNAFESYNLNNWINKHKEEYNKPIFITEIGIDDRVSNFASTFVWNFGYGEDYNNGEVQKIMLKGIFETLKDNKNLDKFYYWFPFRGNAVKEVINYYVGGAINE